MSFTLNTPWKLDNWPQGSQWIACADLAKLHAKIKQLEFDLAAAHRYIDCLEADADAAKVKDADTRETFLAVVGSLR